MINSIENNEETYELFHMYYNHIITKTSNIRNYQMNKSREKIIYINCNNHAMSLYINNIGKNQYIVTFFNSGLGNNHHPTGRELNKNIFPTTLAFLQHKTPISTDRLNKALYLISLLNNNNNIDEFYLIIINYLFIKDENLDNFKILNTRITEINMDIINTINKENTINFISETTHNINIEPWMFVVSQTDGNCCYRCILYQYMTFVRNRIIENPPDYLSKLKDIFLVYVLFKTNNIIINNKCYDGILISVLNTLKLKLINSENINRIGKDQLLNNYCNIILEENNSSDVDNMDNIKLYDVMLKYDIKYIRFMDIMKIYDLNLAITELNNVMNNTNLNHITNNKNNLFTKIQGEIMDSV